jgi:hypothetical protein
MLSSKGVAWRTSMRAPSHVERGVLTAKHMSFDADPARSRCSYGLVIGTNVPASITPLLTVYKEKPDSMTTGP